MIEARHQRRRPPPATAATRRRAPAAIADPAVGTPPRLPPPPADTVLARRLADAVARRPATEQQGPRGSALLQRFKRLAPLNTALGGTKATTNWGRLAAKVAEYNAAVFERRSFIVRQELLDEVDALLHAGKALDTGFRGLRHRDARKTKREAAQTLLAQIATERAALQAERQTMRGAFGAIGIETWRMYIDLRRQHFGSDVFDSGLHGKAPEPGYVASMANAHRFARDHLGEPMTAADYEQLQSLTRAHSSDATMAGWSSHTDRVNADRSTAGAAFEQQILHDAWAGGLDDAYKYAQDRGIPMGDTFQVTKHPATLNFAFAYEGKSEAASKARIQALFDGFYAALRTTADPLREIAALHKNLEYMHAFKDANTRTNLVVLNKLLVESGFNPVVLDDPNQSYTQTIDEWVALVQRGMKRWRAVRRARTIGLDLEQFMIDFDAVAGTPARNRLQPLDASARYLIGVDFTT